MFGLEGKAMAKPESLLMSAESERRSPACEPNATWELRGQTRGTGQTQRQKRWLTRR